MVTFASRRPAHSLLMFTEIHQAERSTDECLEPGQCYAVLPKTFSSIEFTLPVQPCYLFRTFWERWTLGGQRPQNPLQKMMLRCVWCMTFPGCMISFMKTTPLLGLSFHLVVHPLRKGCDCALGSAKRRSRLCISFVIQPWPVGTVLWCLDFEA